MKKKISLLTAVLLTCTIAFTACKGSPVSDGDTTQTEQSSQSTEDVGILNFKMPEIGEEIAVIKVKDYGTIKVKLFAEEAKAAAPDPDKNAVNNFVELAKKGYYDELIFHRVIKEFMDQGGDPKGDGTGGNSTWGGSFDGGIIPGLYHFSGAIAYANSNGTSTDSSQFYIVNTPEDFLSIGGYYDENGQVQYYKTFDETSAYDNVPQEVKDKYYEVGGVPFLDGGYTVFGQTFEGLDVVRAIGEAETDENDKPIKQIQIESITIEEYQG